MTAQTRTRRERPETIRADRVGAPWEPRPFGDQILTLAVWLGCVAFCVFVFAFLVVLGWWVA